MKKTIFSIVLSLTFFFFCVQTSTAQSEANLLYNRPEVEIIIGLNHITQSLAIQVKPKGKDEYDIFETNFIDFNFDNYNADANNEVITNDVVNVIHNTTDNYFETDILEDYSNDSDDELDGVPEKEELILERISSADVSVYPNPASDFINVKFEKQEQFEIEIYDLIGNLVISQTYNNLANATGRVDVSHLQNGIYIMHIITPTERIFKKFGVK